MMKYCEGCQKLKGISAFGLDNDGVLIPFCRECIGHSGNVNNVVGRTSIKKIKKSDVLTNADREISKTLTRDEHEQFNKYIRYKVRAANRKREFDLVFEQFQDLINGCCNYCGSTDNIGVDRVDSDEGYVSKNCVSCCAHCNMMKHKYPVEHFIEHVNRIYKYNSENK